MPALKPYLLKGVFEWLLDCEQTPYVLVNAKRDNVHVPLEHVDQEGRIVLNMGVTATRDLNFGDHEITFSARFSGRAMLLAVPYAAVLALYSKESGKGMVFSDGGEQASTLGLPAGASFEDDQTELTIDEHVELSSDPNDGDDDPSPPSKKRPALRVVK